MNQHSSALSNLEEMKAGRSESPYRERCRGSGGPIRPRPNEKRTDSSPYGIGVYLSPPPDTSWRRTNSDSALHQSAMNMGITDGQLLGIGLADTLDPSRKQLSASSDGRPRSCYEVPRVPGIKSFTMLKLVDLMAQSPQAVSPSTLSPTSQPSRPMGRFSFGGSPQDSQGPSPGHSPETRRRYHHNLVIGPQSPTQLSQTNHLSVPSLVNTRYLHTCKPHLNSLSTYRSPQPLSRPSPQTSPGFIVQGSLVYRSGSPGETSHSGPQSPVSPASSPGIGPNTSPFPDHNSYFLSQAQANALQQHFEQFSMMDNPVSTSYIGSPPNNTTHYSQVSEERVYGLEYSTSPYTTAVSHSSPEDGLTQVGTQELATDPGYYSQSSPQLQYNRPVINPSGGSTQQTTPQTPNTPSSIPDIILTDFSSSAGDDLSRQEFVKDLGSAMSGSFDPDLLPSDEMLREGLEPIDFDGLQMLTDPEIPVITDSATEDNFRLDKL
ncbi:hypothetical protein C0J52_06492 [Blattella germanica]|nr:hypothetical protein C0J52_06492 [Blattella germanica]